MTGHRISLASPYRPFLFVLLLKAERSQAIFSLFHLKSENWKETEQEGLIGGIKRLESGGWAETGRQRVSEGPDQHLKNVGRPETQFLTQMHSSGAVLGVFNSIKNRVRGPMLDVIKNDHTTALEARSPILLQPSLLQPSFL